MSIYDFWLIDNQHRQQDLLLSIHDLHIFSDIFWLILFIYLFIYCTISSSPSPKSSAVTTPVRYDVCQS